MYMTYTFQWLRPEVSEGSKEAEDASMEYKRVAKMAVSKSIEAIRRLVNEGQIK